MNVIIAIFALCIALLYLFEGIEVALHKKSNSVYKLTHIVYPLYLVCAIFYFLMAGVIK